MDNRTNTYAEERAFAVFVGVLLIAALVFMIRSSIRTGYGGPFSNSITGFFALDLLTLILLAAWFALLGHRQRHRRFWKFSVIGAVTGVVAGFLLGFVVPILSGSAQGPLFGIFFAIPLGLPLGAMAGLFVGLVVHAVGNIRAP